MHPKYVIVRVELMPGVSEEAPFLFPAAVPHKLLARLGTPVAAGFYDLAPNGVHVWGESVGLGIRSRGQVDSDLIALWLMRRPAAMEEAR